MSKRVAVIGYGRMGRQHARILRELGHEVVTIDPRASAEADHPTIFDCPMEELDGAVIAVPVVQLADTAKAVQSFAIPTLIEKPLADSLEAIANANLDAELSTPGYVERYNPALRALDQHIERIGPIRHIESRRLGLFAHGDVIRDLASHEFDALRFLGFEPMVEAVHRRGDHASIVWAHVAGGCGGTITASSEYRSKIRTVEVVGEGGMLTLDYQRQTLYLHDAIGATALPVIGREPLREELIAWLAGKPAASYGDGVTALELCVEADHLAGANGKIGV